MKNVIAEFNERLNRYKQEVEKNNTVLVIDDEEVVRMVMEEIISGMNLRVLLAETGEEGVECVKSHPVNLVVTDKNLPGISGVDVMKQVKQLSQLIEVIMLTGYASFESALQAIEIGAYDYITKPFESVDVIRTKIMRALHKQNQILVYRKMIELLKEMASGIMKELGEVNKELVTRFARDLQVLKQEIKRKNRVFILEASEEEGRFLEEKIRQWGFEASFSCRIEEARKNVGERKVDVLVVERMLGDEDGLNVIKEFKKLDPALDAVLITSDHSLQAAIDAIRSGVSEYILRPYESPFVIEKKLRKVVRDHNEKLKYTVLIARIKQLLKEALSVARRKTPVVRPVSTAQPAARETTPEPPRVVASPPQKEKRTEDAKLHEEKGISSEQTERQKFKGRILVVDDEEVILDVLKELLTSHGYEVLTAATGEEGVEIVKKTDEIPVIITDKNLPGISGLDLIKEVKYISPDTQFVVITGYASVDSADTAMKLGVCEYIVKPLGDLKDILTTVERAFTRYHKMKKIQEEIAQLERENEQLKWKYKKIHQISEES